ncbi:hypothetical protein [Schlesneria sp. T3-172]|uniref:hypothetical protein n=1 Tax=Schlesneria TaxID=656899 RepID=UPI002F01B72C
MNRALLCSLGVALAATVVSAGESRSVRGAFPFSLAPSVLGQSGGIPMPEPLTPVPDPEFNQTVPPAYAPNRSSNYTPSPYSAPATGNYPIPGTVQYGTPASVVSEPAFMLAAPNAEIYQNVRYRAVRNIAPGAVPMIVQVPDPCNRDACCKTCVNVQICVPPCDPQRVKVSRDGSRLRYDFGKYSVSVRSVGKHVVVHYED